MYINFKIYFIDYAITVVPFSPFIPLHPAHPLSPTFPLLFHVHGSYRKALWLLHFLYCS